MAGMIQTGMILVVGCQECCDVWSDAEAARHFAFLFLFFLFY